MKKRKHPGKGPRPGFGWGKNKRGKNFQLAAAFPRMQRSQ